MHKPRKGHVPRRALAAMVAVALMILGIATIGQAAQAAPSDSKNVVALCATTLSKNQAQCFGLRRTDITGSKGIQPNLTPAGYGPGDLQSAYNLPADGGAGQTVAIVDAFDDPNAEADLTVYRSQFGLPACTTANGCFSKIDQNGGTSYPSPDAGWAGEISLDLDMVSAIAPLAHILLVEADDNFNNNLYAAEDEAVAEGAKYVSNSWGSGYDSTPGSGEDPGETTSDDPFFNHPGVAIVASSGDGGYGVSYPAASQYVTAVGGTSLVADSSARGWSESVWNNSYGAPGSGCSIYEPKPAWQTDSGCSMRAEADVAAVADPETGVTVYNTYGDSGWSVYGGTSAASPIIAATFADAGTPIANTYPSSYPYAASSHLNDVTTGNDGSCTVTYECTAGPGYDGPTGLGTPNGLAAFTSGPHGTISGTVSTTSGPLSGATVTAGDSSATTDSSGHYSISEPVGTYDVTATDFGYASSTVSGVTVTDGATLTEDFTLTAVPSVTISGKVKDGSGHGWPLYAGITVSGAPGKVYSDPYTGAYSLTLPAENTYTVHVASVLPGYQATDFTVTAGDSDITQNLSVPVDASGCYAPGYGFSGGLHQSFDSTSTPSGWTVTNNTSGGGWAFNNPGNRTNMTGGTGNFAIVDSDKDGIGQTQMTYLTSPLVNLSTDSAPAVSFDTDYHDLASVAQVQLSTDGGTTWSVIWDKTDTDFRGPQHVDIPVPQAANDPTVKIQFFYTGNWAWWWEIDNVQVGTSVCAPTPGGLVAGTVTDANTGAGIVGATVTSAADSSVVATTVATPDDPNVDDGFYYMFSPETGTINFTAARSKYTSLTKSVAVAADKTKKTLYSLQAGQVTVSPTSIDESVKWDGTATQGVVFKNTGGSSATVTLSEGSGGFTLLAQHGAPLEMIKGKYSPLSLHSGGKVTTATATVKPDANPSDAPWTAIGDYPTPIQDNGTALLDGKVYSGFGYTGSNDTSALYVYDPGAGSWSQLASASDTREKPAFAAVDGRIYATGGWGASGDPDAKTEIYDPDSNSWTTGANNPSPLSGSGVAVLNGKIYIVGGCTASSCGTNTVSVYDPSSDSWSSAAPYPVAVSWESCGAIDGVLYCAGGNTDAATLTSTYAYDPSSDSWTQMANIPADIWGSGYTVASGELLVSGGVVNDNSEITNEGFAFDPSSNSWSAIPNSNNALYRGGSACGFYKVGGNPGGFLVPPVASSEVLPGETACGTATDVPWLTETPATFTLAAGQSLTATVTVDATDPSITQPGTYSAKLLIATDTPYSVSAIPVSMTVSPPRTWGKITGTVTAGGNALAGATVQIDTWAGNYTLKTDVNGNYALWLDARSNPLTIIVAKDGYQPQVKTVKIIKGATTSLNFALLKD